MRKTLVGSRLRQLRREHNQTQAEMAKALGVSPAYVNLLENNQRSLSVQVLLSLSDAYGVDWRDIVNDTSAHVLADVRNAVQDPIFAGRRPDIQELRSAIDHAPVLVDAFLHLHQAHRTTLEKLMSLGGERSSDALVAMSPETMIHDFFRDHSNHFSSLERAAEGLRRAQPHDPDDAYAMLKGRLRDEHGIKVVLRSVEDMPNALRDYDDKASEVRLSEALDYQNRTFQLAHITCLLDFGADLDALVATSHTLTGAGVARCRVELANYFAAAFLMPYEPFLKKAEEVRYDIDRLAAAFNVSFEQVCQRLTTLQREGMKGVPFFFLRVDKAGNVTKRFNSTTFNIAEYGGSCPVWNLHTAFRTPGVVVPQFVELPDGGRFFTMSRTTERPAYSHETQDRRLAMSLGCEISHAHKLVYSARFNTADDDLFSPIGINCQLCPRQACAQRAHQPLFLDLPIDANRRGRTRYES